MIARIDTTSAAASQRLRGLIVIEMVASRRGREAEEEAEINWSGKSSDGTGEWPHNIAT